MTDTQNDEGVDEAGRITESDVGADSAPLDGAGDPDDIAERSTAGDEDAVAAADGDATSDDAASDDGDPEQEAEGDGDTEDDPVGGRDRLEALQEDIDEVRRRVADPTDQGEEKFIQKGDADDDQPMDDTIAPPG